jgi:uncharacterized DUF497 family protein
VRVEWDSEKDRANRIKHGLGFDEVRALFEGDANYLVIYDEEHSDDEDRAKGIVIVAHTEPSEAVIRIISARMATRAEEELFYKRTGGHRR